MLRSRGIAAADIAATRRTLLAMIRNLAGDEAVQDESGRRVPSTRHLGDVARAAARASVTRKIGKRR